MACLPLYPSSPDVKPSPYQARQLRRNGIPRAISPWEVDQQGPALSRFHCHRLCQSDLHAEEKRHTLITVSPLVLRPGFCSLQAGAGFRRRLTQVQC